MKLTTLLFLLLVGAGSYYVLQEYKAIKAAEIAVREAQLRERQAASRTLEAMAEDRRREARLAGFEQRLAIDEARLRVERRNDELAHQSELRDWKNEFDEHASRRSALRDYNASKDAVSEVLGRDQEDVDYRVRYPYTVDLPRQTLTRTYGGSASLRQNESN